MREQLFLSLLAGLLLLVYHILLWRKLRVSPAETSIGLANQRRAQWVERLMTENKDILAVQTLRNLTMAASFLATTAIMLGLATMNALLGEGARDETLRLLSEDVMTADKLWVIKLLFLSGTFFFSFFNFMLSVRYYNHAAVFINVYPAEDDARNLHKPGLFIKMNNLPKVHVALRPVAEAFNHGAAHYTLGMRGYYFVLPFSLWLFGGGWFLIGSILLVVVLTRIDSAG